MEESLKGKPIDICCLLLKDNKYQEPKNSRGKAAGKSGRTVTSVTASTEYVRRTETTRKKGRERKSQR